MKFEVHHVSQYKLTFSKSHQSFVLILCQQQLKSLTCHKSREDKFPAV